MAITNGYCTLTEVKARLGISDTTDDTVLEQVVESVSRSIDDWCSRRFYAASQTRYYTAVDPSTVLVDDLLSVTTLKTDPDGDRTYDTTWATTDYDLEPVNATLESQAQPYTSVCVAPLGDYSFPTHNRGVQIVGSFGFAATTPPVIKEACLIQCARIFRRRESPFGIAGSPDLGTVRLAAALDPDVRMMLAPFKRRTVG